MVKNLVYKVKHPQNMGRTSPIFMTLLLLQKGKQEGSEVGRGMLSSPIPSTSWWSASCSVAGCGCVTKHSCKYPQQQRPVNKAGTKFLKQIHFSYFVGLFPVVLNLHGESITKLCRHIKFNSIRCLPLVSPILKQIHFSYFVGLIPVVLNLHGENKTKRCRHMKFSSIGCLPLVSPILKQIHFSYFVWRFPASVLNSHVGSKINICRYIKYNFINYVPWICLGRQS